MRYLALLLCFFTAIGAARPAFVPKDATAGAACVNALGDVYWNPAKLPFGPAYGVFQGRPIFVEFMISQAEFAKGRNWQNLVLGTRTPPVDHIDIWFAPHGHDGAPQPHFDIILFFVSHKRHMKICNPSGALPDFVLPGRFRLYKT